MGAYLGVLVLAVVAVLGATVVVLGRRRDRRVSAEWAANARVGDEFVRPERAGLRNPDVARQQATIYGAYVPPPGHYWPGGGGAG
ncbi:hypothetical protein ACIB24_22805 [Spongisporangium articulatum]|uniref:Secreted protein n=1 Tax=Spongisporangium articulatum TaxID=3362603 RepID=A0ABW8AU68_9ACTN